MSRPQPQPDDSAALVHATQLLRSRGRPSHILQTAVQALGLTAFLVGTIIFFSWRTEYFLTYQNAITILSTVAVIGIVSIGQTFAIVSGGFDLSVSGTIPLVAIVYAMLVNDGVSFVLAILLAMALGASIGLFNGLTIVGVGINPLIMTLGTLSITGGAAFAISNGLTVGFLNIADGRLADNYVRDIPGPIFLMLGLVLIAGFVLRFTVFGRAVYSVGGNREASWLAGIRVDLVVVSVYVISALTASFAGIILASQLLAGSGTLGANAALVSITAVILGGGALSGGEGGIFGTMIGVLVLGALANGLALMQVSSFYQQIVTGVVLLTAVSFGQLRSRIAWE